MTATPVLARVSPRIRASRSVSSASSPEEGSSSIRSRGDPIIALPSSTSRAWPRSSASTGRPARSPRPSSSRTSSTCWSSPGVGPPRWSRSRQMRTVPLAACSATRRWSATVIPSNSSMRWKVRPIPSRQRFHTGRRSMRRPSKCDRPLVGMLQAEQAVEERGLPGAVRTDDPDGLTGADLEIHVVQRHDATEALGDPRTRPGGCRPRSSRPLAHHLAGRSPAGSGPSRWRQVTACDGGDQARPAR